MILRLSEKGFTLMEMLIVLVISAMVGTLLVSFVIQSNGIFFEQNAVISQGESSNQALEDIRNYLKLASNVVAGYPVVSPLYTSGPNTLVLAIPSIDSSGNVLANTFDYYVVTKDPQKPAILKEMLFVDATSSRKSFTKILSTRLSSISFTYFDQSRNIVAPIGATQVNYVVKQIEKAGIANKQSSSSAQVNLRNN